MSIDNWKELEDFVMNLIKKDRPIKPKGSGSSKKEEDVVGETIIGQCKYSDNVNVSLLSKDLNRLIEAAELLGKFPIFVNQSGNNPTIISIPIISETKDIVDQILCLVMILHKLNKLNEQKGLVKFKTKVEVEHFDRNLEKVKKKISTLTSELNEMTNSLEQFVKSNYNDLLMYNLFDEVNNE